MKKKPAIILKFDIDKHLKEKAKEKRIRKGKIRLRTGLPTAEEVAKATKRLIKPTASARKKMNELHIR